MRAIQDERRGISGSAPWRDTTLLRGLVLGMCFWPAAPVVTACMFVGQGALALGIALFLAQLYRGEASGEHPDV